LGAGVLTVQRDEEKPAEIAFQPVGETVFIGAWRQDDDFPIHPKGSQPKRTLVAPTDVAQPYLIGGHTYMFKTAKKEWQTKQLWSEVIAYRLGMLCGLRVPPCFVAVDDATGETGVLMEFFFGYADEDVTPRVLHGGDLLARVIKDQKRGRPHGVRHNVTICRRYGVSEAAEWWGQALVFDALIANVDRHPDNWGVMVKMGQAQVGMTPLFDNGTSLGYGLTEGRIEALMGEDGVKGYASKGTHHCGWDLSDDGPAQHVDLCANFAFAYPEAIAAMRNVIRFDMEAFSAVLDDLTHFDVPVPLTAARAAFIKALVSCRRSELADALKVVL